MRLTEVDLSRLFSAKTLERARELLEARRVLDISVDPDGTIRSEVLGSGAAYRQIIHFSRDKQLVRVTTSCTCPVGSMCKHSAAVLLARSRQASAGDAVPNGVLLPPDPQVERWLTDVRQGADTSANAYPPDMPHRLLYFVSGEDGPRGFQASLKLRSTRLKADGEFGQISQFRVSSPATQNWARYVRPVDIRICTAIYHSLAHKGFSADEYLLKGPDVQNILEMAIDTGRCFIEGIYDQPLKLGPARKGELEWSRDETGAFQLQLAAPAPKFIASSPPMYFDSQTVEVGLLQTGIPDPLFAALVQSPKVRPEHMESVRVTIREVLPNRTDLWPPSTTEPVVEQGVPVAVLELKNVPALYDGGAKTRPGQTRSEIQLPVASLNFRYADELVAPQSSKYRDVEPIRCMRGDQPVAIIRDANAESDVARHLMEQGFSRDNSTFSYPDSLVYPLFLGPGLAEPPGAFYSRVHAFLQTQVPRLRELGWEVTTTGFPEFVPDANVQWQIETNAEDEDWFELSLGIIVDGEKMDMRPILVAALQEFAAMGNGKLDDVSDEATVLRKLPNGKMVEVRWSRLKPVVKALTELFGAVREWPNDFKLALSRIAEMQALHEAASAQGLQWQEPELLKQTRERLRQFSSIKPVTVPKWFKASLRPYQAEGVAWLQFLREMNFSGILADDMGLGKTVQTLAHVAIEKQAKRLKKPVLIVAPTSTLPNWRNEIERFTPKLKVVVHHGPARNEAFKNFNKYDIIITSYPLLARDRDEFVKREFHLVVLDEAQNIKNQRTNVAQAASALNTEHRICLSGTPIENRLEELWSQFHFLMPGLLGNLSEFRRSFVIPMEKDQDPVAREALTRRVRPFILRRTKALVAKELPPKTEVVELVQLDGAQRDLYESLRLAMDKRVRDVIAVKGLEKSRIEVLDALLKLRQVCCDPRLVKLAAARKVEESAKLSRLVEMIDELRSDDRRILIFSQFTTMLDLIEGALRESGHEWVRISGDVEDRETPVKLFQAGKVPIFLISLRAGGTGLNLTAADTVIHFDPWWNPAVENQATDRAYRIGQTKNVFVYKLVAEGTVEEKILGMQARKAALAAEVLNDEGDPIGRLSADDLLAIFE